MAKYIKASETTKFDFSYINSEDELDKAYGDILERYATELESVRDYYSFWGATEELPYRLRKIADILENLGTAYFKRSDELGEYGWVYRETPIDYVLEVYTDKDFVEVTGRAGADTLTFRKYDSGKIVER